LDGASVELVEGDAGPRSGLEFVGVSGVDFHIAQRLRYGEDRQPAQAKEQAEEEDVRSRNGLALDESPTGHAQRPLPCFRIPRSRGNTILVIDGGGKNKGLIDAPRRPAAGVESGSGSPREEKLPATLPVADEKPLAFPPTPGHGQKRFAQPGGPFAAPALARP